MSRMRVLLAAVVTTAIALGAYSALAVPVATQARMIVKVAAKAEPLGKVITQGNFEPVESVLIDVPANSLLIARFTAESNCIGTTTGAGACSLDITARAPGASLARNMHPISGPDFSFDSSNTGQEGSAWEAHAVQKFLKVRKGGVWEIQVSGGPRLNATHFHLDDWALIVEVATV